MATLMEHMSTAAQGSGGDQDILHSADNMTCDALANDRLVQLQRHMAVSHWRGLPEDARAALPEYHLLVDALYFNRMSR